MSGALAPAGVEALAIAQLTFYLFVGGAVIWVVVMALAFYAMRSDPDIQPGDAREGSRDDRHERAETRKARLFIIVGGVLFPVVTLAGLLTYGLSMLPAVLAEDGELVIDVTGEQWWWRVQYGASGAPEFETANEIRLPVGTRTTFRLGATDVIHSFWIPPLGGKIDMIPGRRTALTVEPTAVGRYRGVCAEFCGIAHAYMAFEVVVMERAAYEEWVRAQALPATTVVASAEAERGRALFLSSGCGACHRVRGTEATGRVAPDLTHVGSRLTLAAGTLPNTLGYLAGWIADPDSIKPGVEMPDYHMLAGDELPAVAAYVAGLD